MKSFGNSFNGTEDNLLWGFFCPLYSEDQSSNKIVTIAEVATGNQTESPQSFLPKLFKIVFIYTYILFT